MPEPHDIGEAVLLKATFTNAAGTATDPSAVTLLVRDPVTEDVTTYEQADLANPAIGTWQKLIVPTVPGKWIYRFIGEGTVAQVGERTFHVTPGVLA